MTQAPRLTKPQCRRDASRSEQSYAVAAFAVGRDLVRRGRQLPCSWRRINVDAAGIKKAYRSRAWLVHPEKWGGDVKAVCAFRRSGRAFDILKDLNQRTAYDATRRDETPITLVPRTHQITEFLGDQARPLRRGRPCFDVSDSKDEEPRELRRHQGLHTDIQLSAPRNRRWLTLLGRVHSATSRFFEHKEDFGIGLPCAHGTHRSEAAAVASARIFTYANSHEEIKVIHLEAGKWRDSCRA